ncbi:hypothetical protein ACSDQ9_05655 [Aestuariimicrobium soli]|uniref:hypothetical protein n=1 Tax=Aestuariimicrobium soli TaxID=2035834 RepID=UPI003EBECEAC
MTSTVQGVLAILAVGLLVLTVAALVDWRSKRRADRELSSPPTSETPDGEPLPTPDYVSADELERSAVTPVPLTPDEASALAAASTSPATLHLTTGLADPRQATRTDPAAPDRRAMVLTHPLFLVVRDGIGSPQEAMQTLERAARSKEPLVLASSAIDPEVVDLVTVNVRQGILDAGTLVLADEDLDRLATTTGATVVQRSDLQAGYVPHSAYGRAAWVSADAGSTTVVPVDPPEEPSTEQ